MSREHFLSNVILRAKYFDTSELGGTVTRKGVPAHDLVVRCLCAKHNSLLAPLDETGGDFFNTVQELDRLHGTWRNFRGPLKPDRFAISGPLLQRWAFKTAASMWCRLARHIGSQPPSALARLAFGLDAPPPRAGIALLVRVGDKMAVEERMHFQFGRYQDDVAPTGMIMRVWGATLYVPWRQLKPNATLVANAGTWGPGEIVFQPKTIQFNITPRYASFLDIKWDPGFRDDTAVVKLRKVGSG